MPPPIHTLVVGPGAIGCFLAAELTRAGRDATLLDHRADRAQRLSSRGIIVEDGIVSHTVRVHATHNESIGADCDLIMVCVKAHATALAASSLADTAREGAIVLTVQNGLGNMEVLREALPQATVAAAVVYFGSRLLDEGHLAVTPNRRMLLGDPDSEATALVEQEFAPTTIGVEQVEDIDRELWRKAIVNAAINPLTAIHRVPNGELPAIPDAMEVAELVVNEAVEVAHARGHAFDADDLIESVVRTCESTATNVSSMRQDAEVGRQTEIDSINGAIVRLGHEAAIPTPQNEKLVRAIQQLTAASRNHVVT